MQIANRNTSPDMPIEFCTRLYGRFIEIKSNFRRKKFHRTNQGSNFLGSSFSNGNNVRDPNLIQERKIVPVL